MKNNAGENDCKTIFRDLFFLYFYCMFLCMFTMGVGDEMIIDANKWKFIVQFQPSEKLKELLCRFITCKNLQI